MAEQGPPRDFPIPLKWIDDEHLQVPAVNQAILTAQESGEMVLTLGYVRPPILVGTPEQQLKQAQEVEFVPVQVVTRVAMTRRTTESLAEQLTAVLHQDTLPDVE